MRSRTEQRRVLFFRQVTARAPVWLLCGWIVGAVWAQPLRAEPSEGQSRPGARSIEDLNLVGAAVTRQPIADSILGVDTAFRRALFSKGMLLRFDSLPRFSFNLLDPPVPASEQAYIGHRPTWIAGMNIIFSWDMRQLGLRHAQLQASAGWRWTTWNPAGPKTAGLTSLYVYKRWGERRAELKVGYVQNDLEFIGMQIGGVLATAPLGVYAVLPYQVGMSYFPLVAPGINLRLQGPAGIYVKAGVQRSLHPEGGPATVRHNRTGLRLFPPGQKLLQISEVGYQRPASEQSRQTWVRAGLLYNTSQYANKIDGAREAGNYCGYLLVDYQLAKTLGLSPAQGWFAGASAMIAPERLNSYTRYYEARVYKRGPFASRPVDLASFVFAYRGFSRYVTDRLRSQGKSVWDDSLSGTLSYSMRVAKGYYLTLGLSYVRGAAITPRVPNSLTLTVIWGFYL
ncbi:MAG: carbohydrate porin [Bryobacteraceae bacterium]|nr:carbohydrate porin [Bryobacteraceae bacterium]